MALWLVRSGRSGERESFALEHGVAIVGWDEVPDLARVTTRPELMELMEKSYPDAKHKTVAHWAGQVWVFAKEMKLGDLVALPLKARAAVAFGEVSGGYTYSPDNPPGAHHARPVKWIKEISRSALDSDIRFSLGAFMTVCRIQRNQAEGRVRALLKGRAMPAETPEDAADADLSALEALHDVEDTAREQIQDYIGRKFRGHALAELVGEILVAQGYQVRTSPAGPDGGIDIIAGRGSLGFGSPRLAVQVKSGDAPVDVKVLRELQGVMKNVGAEHGLFVSLGGFKSSVEKEAARLFFELRLWNADDLVRELQGHYDKLPEATQASLPLKRIWTLILEDAAET